ncbi:ABC transporter ATP-binding protein [Paralcaligenes ureilyticus]|uniref:Amino acid/amide ABC transporter ATP-binding protein 2 (HAAT family) n=1 Tax=Paralcaligenes ureilyticus TaxID=627131 RepID=A0A4R3M966_9BURK|nr:ABC transporter ATP-binding protein [Paralcaligenes ureilyticus]TCT09662.1 amino acid/amide ABC transporter ATP-binding protein 2 (HAAT family) [Paralcaligenes ureilyticus]
MSARQPLLSVEALQGWYGKSHILQGVNFDVCEGELVTLLGRNGAGKTTTLRAITGLLPRVEGAVRYGGKELIGLAPHVIARSGVALVPENRGIFAGLTVQENLSIAIRRHSIWTMARVREFFPELEHRLNTPAGKLSGGEQQMLTIARALLTGPRVLLLDEPTEGLAPVIVERLVSLFSHLKTEGLAVVLVEHNFEICLTVADRHFIIDGGEIVWTGDSDSLANAEDVISRHLSLENV